MNNNRRAALAETALGVATDFGIELGELSPLEDGERKELIRTYAADLVANLFHLLDQYDLDRHSVIRRALNHFEEEKYEEENGYESDRT